MSIRADEAQLKEINESKNINDYSIKELENGKKVVRIPAFAYLYLLGLEEMRNIEK